MEVEMDLFPATLVLATDGSENTAQATRAAVDIARRRGSKIHLVHVWHDVPTSYAHAFVKVELRRQGRETLDEEVKRIQEKGGTVTRSHLRAGSTFEETIRLSEETAADLLVVGSRGHSGLRCMLLGSNSEDIIHHAHCPVLVVRSRENVWPPSRVVAGDPAEVLLEAFSASAHTFWRSLPNRTLATLLTTFRYATVKALPLRAGSSRSAGSSRGAR